MKLTKEAGRKILRKIYVGLGLTSAALVFQACYGVDPGFGQENDILIRGVVKSKTTNDPIEGIKVGIKAYDEDMYVHVLTDDAGKFEFYIPPYYVPDEMCVIQLEDIDGTENGSYSSKEFSVEKNTMELGDILLDVAE